MLLADHHILLLHLAERRFRHNHYFRLSTAGQIVLLKQLASLAALLQPLLLQLPVRSEQPKILD
jgi:hypothetical protein